MRSFALGIVGLLVLGLLSVARGEERGELAPEKAIVGHWEEVLAGGKPGGHFYFTETGYHLKSENDTSGPFKITKVASDADQHWLKVKVQSGRPHERTFHFADENRSLLVAVKIEFDGRAIYVNSIWKYVDAKTAP